MDCGNSYHRRLVDRSHAVRTSDFRFDLPPELIAQEPLPDRSASRLLLVDRAAQRFEDGWIRELPERLAPGDLLVFNDTRVLQARLFGRKQTGGSIELLVERVISERRAMALVRASKAPALGSRLVVDGASLTVADRDGAFYVLDADEPVAGLLDRAGHVPLPPYVRRPDSMADRDRYQTVYARHGGSVAAPTAGLHFDDGLLARLADRGVGRAFVTLHVGAGTFQPVRVDDPAAHTMHRERFWVPPAVAAAHRATRAAGNRVVAVGTTSLRALETCSRDGAVSPGEGETKLFIRPGGPPVRSIDGLLTNFHLPESTLLMLVCALAGTDLMLAAYRHAVAERYRFFSYGDAMLIL